MKKSFILTAIAILLAVASATAQQIAVVSEGGETSVYQTLQQAIEGAGPGSVIYLPGGGFPLPDSVKITKRLTIIGIGHRYDNDNVDGVTIINGNLFFNEGSSSAIIGCYLTGVVNIGNENASVNNTLIKCCNIGAVTVHNASCTGTVVNQNYIRNCSDFNSAEAKITNNIVHSLVTVDGGNISNNIIVSSNHGHGYDYQWSWCICADNCIIANNILLNRGIDGFHRGNNCVVTGNMVKGEWGQDCINMNNVNWNDVFVNYNNASIGPASNFHFTEAYQQYESQVGVYAGGVDFDKQIAHVPYVVAKRIAEETDAAGQLKIQVRVKAGD